MADELTFTDAKSSDYFWYPVKWAVSNGLTSETRANTFSPLCTCTRTQIVTFRYKNFAF